MTLYRIKDWSKLYETHETRKLVELKWVPLPNKHDGLSFRQLAAHKNGPALYAAWILLVQIASKSDRSDRGALVRHGNPMTPADMALVTGFPAKIFEQALAHFSHPSVGWIVTEEIPSSPDNLPSSPGEPGSSPENLPDEWNGMEWNGKKGMEVARAAGAAPASDSEFLDDLQKNEAYRDINVSAEFAKMQVWCRENKKSPSRKRFVNWLNRCERPMRVGAARINRPDIYAEPRGWRSVLQAMHELSPEAVADKRWDDLSPDMRSEILKRLPKSA